MSDTIKKKIAIGVVSALVVVLIGVGVALATYVNGINKELQGDKTSEELKAIDQELTRTTTFTKPFYVMLIGSDAREGDDEMGQRSDTNIVARVDPSTNTVTMVSIPRDTMVNVNWDVKKINSVYNMNGGVAETTLSQGFHLVKPTQKVTTYTIGIEQSYLTSGSDGDSKGDESFEVPSNDGKGLTVDMTFTYRFDPDQVADTFTRFKGQSGKDVKEVFIKPNIMSWTKEVTAKYSVIDLLGDQRASLNSELTAYLKDKFEPYGIIIESVSLINIDPDDETRAAVQKKVNAQQDLELAKIEQQTANVNAEKEKEVAITKANQEKETAQINAEAKLIEAQAQADANRLISQSLTPELIQQQMYEKWNGQLPTVQSGSDTPIIVDTTN